MWKGSRVCDAIWGEVISRWEDQGKSGGSGKRVSQQGAEWNKATILIKRFDIRPVMPTRLYAMAGEGYRAGRLAK